MLGELETAVLEHLWEQGVSDAKEVHECLGGLRGITLNTIQSTLERLHRKQLLIREKVSHAYRYAPAIARAEFRARAMAAAAGDLRSAEGAGAIAAFVDLVARTDRKRLEDLAALVDAARARRKPRG